MKYLFIALLFATTLLAQPWTPEVIWQREGAGDSSLYGHRILALGDQNNDGYNDWAVRAFGWGGPGQINEAKVEFFHGGNPPEAEPYLIFTGDSTVPSEGAETIGDVNADGYIDWIMYYRLCGDIEDCLEVRFYLGGPDTGDSPEFVKTIGGFSGYDPIGDFNGDGFDDLLFSDTWVGYTDIYFGGSPFDTIPDWSLSTGLIGFSHGDINGDGFSDFISYRSGNYLDIYLGSELPDTNYAFRWITQHGDVPLVRDVNHDGYDDMLFTRTARTDVYFGGLTVMDTIADAHLDFACGPDTGPYRATSLGDINGDGYGDVAEWTYYCPNSWFGTLTVHLGGATISPQPVWIYEGWTAPYNVIGIEAVVGLGDVNGDGVSDFALGGCTTSANMGWRGKTVVLSGIPLSADDPRSVPTPQKFAVSVYPNPFNSSTNIRIKVPTGKHNGQVKIYNLLGEAAMQRDVMSSGPELTMRFDGLSDTGNPVGSGIYILTVRFDDLVSSQKLVLIR